MHDGRPACGIATLITAELTLQRWRHASIALPYWRLYWNPEAGAAVHSKDRRLSLGPDRLVLIAPETIYTTSAPDRPYTHVFAHFTVQGYDWQPRTGIVSLDVDPCRAALVTTWRQALAADDMDQTRLCLNALACHLLAALPADWRRPSETAGPIRRALDYLRQHHDRTVGNDELAHLVKMHTNSFIRAFRRSTGSSPQAWHQRDRISRAGMELVASDASIDDIAAAFGYCDRHHFSRVFKRLRGLGPAAWRRRARDQ
ncbi:MAG: helix-turn-helix domain-containing protein [Planctomycetota bacterium]